MSNCMEPQAHPDRCGCGFDVARHSRRLVEQQREQIDALRAENTRLKSEAIYAAAGQDVSALVDALEACRNELLWMIKENNKQDAEDGSWLYDYQTVAEADEALAANKAGDPRVVTVDPIMVAPYGKECT